MTSIIIFCLSFYLISALLFYLSLKKSYSKGGRWENLSFTATDYLIILLPIFNLVAFFLIVCFYPSKKK